MKFWNNLSTAEKILVFGLAFLIVIMVLRII